MNYRKQHVNLRTFARVMNKCVKNCDGAKGPIVIFYIGDKEYRLRRVGQFGVMPDVTIDLVKVQ